MGAIVILPARGGSKRIPFKNGRPFCDQPMMTWPIAAARDSGLFDRIVVSTDDDRLAEIAAAAGAEAPFRRDAALADDLTDTKSVIADAVRQLDLPPDTTVLCLYPTAVFTTPADLRDALDRHARSASWVFAAAEFPAPIDRAYRRTDTGFAPRWPGNMPKRSQDLDPAYFDAGQFYVASARQWAAPQAQIWDRPDAVLFEASRVVDIDTEDDWDRAEALFRLQHPV